MQAVGLHQKFKMAKIEIITSVLFLGIVTFLLMNATIFEDYGVNDTTFSSENTNFSFAPGETGNTTLTCSGADGTFYSFTSLINTTTGIAFASSNYTNFSDGKICALDDLLNDTQINATYSCNNNDETYGSKAMQPSGIIPKAIFIVVLVVLLMVAIKVGKGKK